MIYKNHLIPPQYFHHLDDETRVNDEVKFGGRQRKYKGFNTILNNNFN